MVKPEIKVLIIDDEVEICHLLSHLLCNKGIKTKFVNTLTDARSLLTSYAPSVIFLDNHLPDGLGIEFITFIKTLYPETRIFIITAKEANFEQALKDGASEIISKPFTSDRIFSAMEKYA